MRLRRSRSFRVPHTTWKRGNPLKIALVAKQLEKSLEIDVGQKEKPNIGITLHAISVYRISKKHNSSIAISPALADVTNCQEKPDDNFLGVNRLRTILSACIKS